MSRPKTVLITGITGQIGSYLAENLLLTEPETIVHGIVRRSSTINTSRIDYIYEKFNGKRLFLHFGDMTDPLSVESIIQSIKPDFIVNLAAQSHVKVSFEMPVYTAQCDALGELYVLEAVRKHCPNARVYQASTSEIFGGQKNEMPEDGFSETTPFHPRSPYGVAKLYAYWITKNYREAYGLFASNGLLFNSECVTAQTPVIIKDNNGFIDIKAIEEVVPHEKDWESGQRKKTTVCDQTNSFQVWDGGSWTRVKSMTATRNDKKNDKGVISVVTRGGFYQATGDHVSFKQGNIETKTSELRMGDKLELRRLPQVDGQVSMTTEEAMLLGMIVSNGYLPKCTNSEIYANIASNNDDYLELASSLWAKVSGGHTIQNTRTSKFHHKPEKHIRLDGNSSYVDFLRKEIYSEKSYKKIPKRILNAPKDIQLAFLKGCGLGNGDKFCSFSTNSQSLALGLCLLIESCLTVPYTTKIALHKNAFFKQKKPTIKININLTDKEFGEKKKPREEIIRLEKEPYTGWLFDFETESGTFSAGVGNTWIHNSPRRGETFVTRKITRWVASLEENKEFPPIYLGNLNAVRDWNHALDAVEGIKLILEQPKPDDFVIATGEVHSVKEFIERAIHVRNNDFSESNKLKLEWKGSGKDETGFLNGKPCIFVDEKYFRPSEVDYLKGNPSKIKNAGWKRNWSFDELVADMVFSDVHEFKRKKGF